MNPEQIAQWPIAAILLAIGMALGGLFLSGRLTLGRETDRAIERAEKAEKGEAELKALLVPLTAVVATQADELKSLTSIAEKLVAMLAPRTAIS